MTRLIAALLMVILLGALLGGCSGGSPASQPTQTAAAPTAAPAAQGETYENDKFSLTVPKGWERMDVDGGVQLYKMSGEIVEVHFRGSNQTESSAKQQVESNAAQYGGTTPQEVERWGKKFWTTTFTASGVEQTSYLRIENGEMFAVKVAGKGHQDNEEIEAILGSITFK